LARNVPDELYEPVLVENDWYDGPRSGLAHVQGVLSYFESSFADIAPNEPDDIFLVWPASPDPVDWEREQWAIFAAWNQRREAGETTADTHPGHGGIDARYDELQALLEPQRIAPDNARRFRAQWRFTHTTQRYHRDGVDYEARSCPSMGSSAV
jgi:hypothetical protein